MGRLREAVAAVLLGGVLVVSPACDDGAQSTSGTGAGTSGSNSSTASTGATTSAGEGGGGPVPKIPLTPCGTGIDCGVVAVPIDYDDASAGTIDVHIARAPALDPKHRIGVVLVNFGGPGGQAVGSMQQVKAYFNANLPLLSAWFDIVGFDPRGVATSAPIDCVDDAYMETARGADVTPGDAAGVAALDTLAKTFADGCVAKTSAAMLENVHTENAARDIDRIRDALSEEKINYLGISYGTILGATYLALFPDRARAFVLDSAVQPYESRFKNDTLQATGYEIALERFFASCAANAACPFHGGTDVATLEAAWDGLQALVRAAPVPSGTRLVHELDFALMSTFALRSYDWPGLAAALADFEAGDGTKLLALADAEIGRLPDATYVHFFEPLLAIGCSDNGFPAGTTMTDVETFAVSLDGMAPRMGRALFGPWFACARWPYPHVAAPLTTTAPPALIVGGKYDPATRYEEAAGLQAALGNGSHVLTYEGEGHSHLQHSECVRGVEQEFLVDPTVAPKTAICAAE